ncbi:MAG: carbohydrate ABC transporter permease [Clostridium sp.]|nr:carbohydrate ABC transporter permease [Clostridium sp.]
MSKRIKQAIMLLIMTAVALISLFPFYMMINMGTYKTNDLYTGIKLVIGNYAKENFHSLMQVHFVRYYFNSVFVSVSCAVLTVLVCSLCGYGLGKYKFRGQKVLSNIVMLTMMVPTQLSLVGFLKEMNFLHWSNTLLPLIIPPTAYAFGVFWIQQFTQDAIPDSVIESAKLDGCGEARVFFEIALPFMKPACVTLALLSFLASWNSFLVPIIIISKESLFTLPLGIKQLATQFRTDLGAQILGLTIATVPILILFGYFSDNLISGLAAAAVKE